MSTHTIDPKKVDIVLFGVRINEGLTEAGTWATLAETTPGFSSKVGVDGDVTRARSHDRRATLTLSLMQSSRINQFLSQRYAADRAATNGRGPGTFFLQDRNGTTIGQASKAWISAAPDLTFGAEAEVREWTIEIADWTVEHGGINLD